MTSFECEEFSSRLRVGDTFGLRNGDRRMLILDNNKYALLDPDTGKVKTAWYDDKLDLVQSFFSKLARTA